MVQLQVAFTPFGSFIFQRGTKAKAAIGTVVQVKFTAQVFIGRPAHGAQQKRAPFALEARLQVDVPRVAFEAAAVVRQVEHRHFTHVHHRATEDGVFAGDHLHLFGLDKEVGVLRVVRGENGIVRAIDTVRLVACHRFAFHKYR